ncbi:MAG: DUF6015 family protein [Thermoplasmata archaeon]
MVIVSIKQLEAALLKALADQNLTKERITQIAEKMLDLFGYSDQVVDNRLTPEDRDLFYMLEEAGLLTTIEEDVQVEKGKTWRIYYWVLKKDQVQRLAQEATATGQEQAPEADIYENIADDVWKQHHEQGD